MYEGIYVLCVKICVYIYIYIYCYLYALTRESGSRFRTPPEAEIPKLLKTKLFPRS